MTNPIRPPEAATEQQLDFWLGEWHLSWPQTQTPDIAPKGSNSIRKVYDGKVIRENFSTADGSFRGMSITVYNAQTGLWQQTWADNQAGYIVLTGQWQEQTLTLQTAAREVKGMTIIQRMRFSNIDTDSLLWQWQLSKDAGESWQDQWTISYQRST